MTTPEISKTNQQEGKATLRYLAEKAAYAVLGDKRLTDVVTVLDETSREVLAEAVAKEFITLLNERRNQRRVNRGEKIVIHDHH